MPKYYLLDENKNLVEGFDKEGFLALLQQAIDQGSLENIDPDSAVASKLRSVLNGTIHHIEFVTQAQYNQLEEDEELVPNTYYFITDDTSLEGLENSVNDLINRLTSVEDTLGGIVDGTTRVPKATHATNADNATNATNATNADNATNATNAEKTAFSNNPWYDDTIIIPSYGEAVVLNMEVNNDYLIEMSTTDDQGKQSMYCLGVIHVFPQQYLQTPLFKVEGSQNKYIRFRIRQVANDVWAGAYFVTQSITHDSGGNWYLEETETNAGAKIYYKRIK